MRTQLGGQSLQNGDIAGSSAATRKPGAKVLAKSSSGGFRPRTVPTDPLDGYAIADLPPDAMLAEAAAFARKAAARTAAEHRLYKPPPKREETETEALFASMGAIQARTRHTDDPDDLNLYKGAERPLSTADVEGAEARGNLKESDPLRIPDRRRQGPKRLTACDDIEGSRPRCRWGVEATLSAGKVTGA